MKIAPRTLLAAWELVKKASVNVFRPGVSAELPAIPGWSSLGLPHASAVAESTVALLDAFRALALQERTVVSATTVELVATLPGGDRTVLCTADVVRTLLESARETILVLGYELSDPAVRKLLIRRGLEQLDVTVVGDRERGSARDMLKDWPAAARPLRALENVEPATGHGVFHAKAIVVDGSRALIGSANFTAGGLRNNTEIGLRVTGPQVAELVRLVARLAADGWLVTPSP